MQYFKLFEEFKGTKNIYALMGQNLQNFMQVKQKELSKLKYFDNRFLKDLQNISEPNKANSLITKDVLNFLNEFFKDLLKKVETLKDKNDLKEIHDLHYKFMSYFAFAFRLDFEKISKFIQNDSWFNFYNIKTVNGLKEQNKSILAKWDKIKDDEKVKNLLITDINVDYKNWLNVFKDEKVLKFRDFTKYVIKPDEQQEEAENKINNFTTHMNNEELKKVEETNAQAAEKIKHLPEIVGFTTDWLERFDQRGLPESHKLMKKWFLESFKKAEDFFGQKLTITSGIRTEEYQKYLTSLGYKTAKKNSPHIQGVAADIAIVNVDVEKLIQAFEKAGFTRFGVGKTFMHVDLGDQLNSKIWVPFARWTYTY